MALVVRILVCSAIISCINRINLWTTTIIKNLTKQRFNINVTCGMHFVHFSLTTAYFFLTVKSDSFMILFFVLQERSSFF